MHCLIHKESINTLVDPGNLDYNVYKKHNVKIESLKSVLDAIHAGDCSAFMLNSRHWRLWIG